MNPAVEAFQLENCKLSLDEVNIRDDGLDRYVAPCGLTVVPLLREDATLSPEEVRLSHNAHYRHHYEEHHHNQTANGEWYFYTVMTATADGGRITEVRCL